LGRPGRRKIQEKMPQYRYPKAVKTTQMENYGAHNQITVDPRLRGEVFNLEQVPPPQVKFPH
jgi:hypothetical protein